MRTEAELLQAAAQARKAVIMSRDGKRGHIHVELHSKYKSRFDTIAWMLKRDPKELWHSLVADKRRDRIPLHTRLGRLTNPTHSGTLLEPKE